MRPKAIKATEFDTPDEQLKVVNELLSELRILNDRITANAENHKVLNKHIQQLNNQLKGTKK